MYAPTSASTASIGTRVASRPPRECGACDSRASSSPGELFIVEWATCGALLRIVEPKALEEVRVHASALAEYYNEPTNRALMTNAHHFLAEDVVERFAEMRAEGGRPFLLFEDDIFMGDGDLRHIERHEAEFAIMVGARARQAKGRGTLFSIMVLALAFGRLGLQRVYASVRPENAGSLRMFEKVGYALDTSVEARRYAEADDDVCLSIDACAFATGVARRPATESIQMIAR
jgi:RimJ/RimL family protein N-acetyltransferase